MLKLKGSLFYGERPAGIVDQRHDALSATWPFANTVKKLYVGLDKEMGLPAGGYLWITDRRRRPRKRHPRQRVQVFDPSKHRFNLLHDLDYRKACDIVSAFENIFPAGATTLTKEGVPDILLEALLNKPLSFGELLPDESKDPSYVSAQRMVRRLMRSPVLQDVLRGETNFSLANKTDVIVAWIDRSTLGDFDALALGLFLIAQFKGQILVEDGGFYLRDCHANLIPQNRLIVGVNSLSELPPKLRQAVLLIPDKIGAGCTVEDAEILASYKGEIRGVNSYNEFMHKAIA